MLMPRRRLLTHLDPDDRILYDTPRLQELIRPYADEYKRVVLKNQDVRAAIKVYCKFKLL